MPPWMAAQMRACGGAAAPGARRGADRADGRVVCLPGSPVWGALLAPAPCQNDARAVGRAARQQPRTCDLCAVAATPPPTAPLAIVPLGCRGSLQADRGPDPQSGPPV